MKCRKEFITNHDQCFYVASTYMVYVVIHNDKKEAY